MTWWRWWRSPPVRDAVLAVVVTAVLLAGTYGEAHPGQVTDRTQFPGHVAPHPPPAAYLLVVVACLALAWRRRWPVAVLVVSTAAVTAWTLLGYVNGAVLLAPTMALYAVATRVSVRRAIALGVATLAVLMTATGTRNPFGRISGGGFYLIPALVAAALFGGIALASRRDYIASIQARAEDTAQRRIDEERLRIARELHDVVAHHMSMLALRADSAPYRFPDLSDDVRAEFAALCSTAREGLTEMRRLLGVLRADGEAAETAPQPALREIKDLVDGLRAAGTDIGLSLYVIADELPTALGLSAYRIAQEALSNAIRHAPGSAIRVEVWTTDSALHLDIRNTEGTEPAAPQQTDEVRARHGLLGMLERVNMLGGRLETGPAEDGGFRVLAELPLHEELDQA
jgi:signal transduction histidine kinase